MPFLPNHGTPMERDSVWLNDTDGMAGAGGLQPQRQLERRRTPNYSAHLDSSDSDIRVHQPTNGHRMGPAYHRLRPVVRHSPHSPDNGPQHTSDADTSLGADGGRRGHHTRNVHGTFNTPAQTARSAAPSMTSKNDSPEYRFEKRTLSQKRGGTFSEIESSSSAYDEHFIVKQPATSPITELQLVNEVKGIYAGLVMVEKKSVEIVAQQSQSTEKLSDQQWKALVALHRTLLQEHHAFFSASQHPTASGTLKNLAIKYAMPARMWRHGIHAFLELLRHRLPDSMEHMLSFIYLSYSMMALLKESEPGFVGTWIEGLGDLARYRMAVDDTDLRDREIWSNVAKSWYNEAANKSPNSSTGRVRYHLAVLTQPYVDTQLLYYTEAIKSGGLRHTSVANMLQQIGKSFRNHIARVKIKHKTQAPQMVSALFVKLRNSSKEALHKWEPYIQQLEALCDNERHQPEMSTMIRQGNDYTKLFYGLQASQTKFESTIGKKLPPNYYTAILSAHSISFGPHSPTAVTQLAIDVGILDTLMEVVSEVASWMAGKNYVPFMHNVTNPMRDMSFVTGALVSTQNRVPWNDIVKFLNTTGRSGLSHNDVTMVNALPKSGPSIQSRQLPEDFLMRGSLIVFHDFADNFFGEPLEDEDVPESEYLCDKTPQAGECFWAKLGFNLSKLWLCRILHMSGSALSTISPRSHRVTTF